MDLMSSLNDSMWQTAAPNDVNGFKNYVIVRQIGNPKVKGRFELHIREDVEDGTLQQTFIDGCAGKSSPLQSVRNVQLKLDGDNIVAINLDDDCVIRK